MLKHHSSLFLITGLCCLIAACSQQPDDFREFLEDRELTYPGAITQTFTQPGNLRLGIGWSPSPDPSVTKYKVYWNNYRDSVEVPASTHSPSDTISTIITGLQEYTYSFFVYSFDEKGNRSIPVEIQNARVYGNTYQNSLMNRPINLTEPYKLLNDDGNEIMLNFLPADSTNTITYIRYTSITDEQKEVALPPDQQAITLNDYKYGTKVAYHSYYTPGRLALDTFPVTLVDTFPPIAFGIVKCDKSLFREISLPYDVGPLEGQTSVARLWDGSTSPQGYPNIFHSNGDNPLPHHFTFDMGKAYDSLRTMEVIGRDCCHNPVEYEVWGIADVSNAATTVPGNDPGWKDDAIAKGWILLKEVNRTDDGKGPYTLDFSTETPQVRYIRIRVKRVASNESAYSNLTELTIGYKK
ncbi:DUF4998 domain-containing protein [Chitinophaga cymbidii]|uniref:Uncharacterized protein n=1 Tax=Chitinophaga cymbidii TaxID=1096750 RepID=A0A512RPI3_9BACT|nr:DUF4998 domain-containing protein [Chitinophaga cymbidii]GEP97594.1 hypothetical protein CCY01nite_38540 [Chitinophaga cymbidii]